MSIAPEIEAIPENLFREPIEYLFADHFRQKVICNFLDRILFDPGAAEVPRLATLVFGYLVHDLPVHIADEERDLFPRMRQLAAGDNVAPALTVLSAEHERDAELSARLIEGLRVLGEGRPPAELHRFIAEAAAFTETQRRHLAWEDGVLLPLARRRLAATDLEALGRAMAARRGAAYPG